MGPISRLLTRQMYLAIESRSVWDHTLRFSLALLEELRLWYNNIDSFNGYSLRLPHDSSTVVFSDASDVAFGCFSASLGGVMASDMFTSKDLGQSSMYRELKAIWSYLLCSVVLRGAAAAKESKGFHRQLRSCKNSFYWQFQSTSPVCCYGHF